MSKSTVLDKSELAKLKLIYETGIMPDHGVLTINQEIDDDCLERIRVGFHLFRDVPVKLIINSPGGDIFAGMSIINYIKLHKYPVDIIVDCMAASMACVILQAATGKRLAMPDAVLMHHIGSIEVNSDHFTNAKKLIVFNEKYSERINKMMLDRVNDKRAKDHAAGKEDCKPRTMAWWKERDAFDQWMTVEEAIDIGLLDEIATELPWS